MSDAMPEVQVHRCLEDDTRAEQVHARFGPGFEVMVTSRNGCPCVHLRTEHVAVSLPADGPDSPFARAVNLLVLHMPNRRCDGADGRKGGG